MLDQKRKVASVANPWVRGLVRAAYIAKKDAKVYYFKAPNLTYGLIVPIFLFLAFSVGVKMEPAFLVTGLTALSILFSTTSIEAVSVVLEKEKGTFERLLTAPVSMFTVVFGKALAGVLFGLIISLVLLVPSLILLQSLPNPLLVLVAIAMSSLTFSSLGVLVSSFARWVPEAQMLSNFIRFPMAFASGVFIPLESMTSSLQMFARLLPLTYSVDALRQTIAGPFVLEPFLIDLLSMTLFSAAFLMIAAKVLEKKTG